MIEYKEISVEDIIITGDNPRQLFDEESLRDLGKSMLDDGQLQEILVRPKGDKFELVTGERRVRAAKLVGIPKLRARIEEIDDARVMELRLIENTQRKDLTDAEKGNAVAHLLAKFPEKYPTIKALAEKLKKSKSTINRWLQKSERLSDYVKKCISRKKLSDRTAWLLVKFDHPTQNKLAEAIIKYQIPTKVEELRAEFVKKYELNPEKYPTVESLEKLANEVKGVRKVKIDLSKLSPEARAEVEERLREAKEEAKKVRARRPKKPRRKVRRQGRPKKSMVKPKVREERKPPEPIPEPTVPVEVKELPIGSLWLPIPLYEKVFNLSTERGLTIQETIIYIISQYFGEE